VEHLLEVLKILDGGVNSDRSKVLAYAEQLASKLDTKGDSKAAEAIRRTIRGANGREVSPSRVTPVLPVDSESRFALADERVFEPAEVRLVVDGHVATQVDEFIRHVRGSAALIASGIGIAPSLLVHGPPGCGKTELAKHIAAQLQVPLLTARTDTLVSSFLGSTSKNLRLLFEHAMGRPCVLFLDEFDAIAKLRDDQHELGELKRVVVSLLQNIDALDSKTVLLAATNHEHLLDRAIWRRFAFRIQLGTPSLEARHRLLTSFLGIHAPTGIDIAELATATVGLSGAELRTICESARRSAVLNSEDAVPDGDLLWRIARARVNNLEQLSLPEQLGRMRRISRKLFTVRRLAKMFDISTGKVSMLVKGKGGTNE
jgi:hypothetical protein